MNVYEIDSSQIIDDFLGGQVLPEWFAVVRCYEGDSKRVLVLINPSLTAVGAAVGVLPQADAWRSFVGDLQIRLSCERGRDAFEVVLMPTLRRAAEDVMHLYRGHAISLDETMVLLERLREGHEGLEQ